MELTTLLAASAATDEFKSDLLGYLATATSGRIHLSRRAPAIKVVRVLTQLLYAQPRLVIERVAIEARSSCSSFDGRIDVYTPTAVHCFEFSWDCQWRAEQEGWDDDFGYPDQIRAANEFGWRCFRVWREAGCAPAGQPTALAS